MTKKDIMAATTGLRKKIMKYVKLIIKNNFFRFH